MQLWSLRLHCSQTHQLLSVWWVDGWKSCAWRCLHMMRLLDRNIPYNTWLPVVYFRSIHTNVNRIMIKVIVTLLNVHAHHGAGYTFPTVNLVKVNVRKTVISVACSSRMTTVHLNWVSLDKYHHNNRFLKLRLKALETKTRCSSMFLCMRRNQWCWTELHNAFIETMTSTNYTHVKLCCLKRHKKDLETCSVLALEILGRTNF